MKTKLMTIKNSADPDLAAAAAMLRQGGLVAFPTETVYGLGANGLDAKAVAGIYLAKGRPSDNPLILHIADLDMLNEIVQNVNGSARKLLAAFCPGPLTLILERKAVVPDEITGGLSTVGIRMPHNEIARALIRLAGVPVAAPSANLSGRPSPTTAEAVMADLDGRIDAVIDGGSCLLGLESTIVDCTSAVPTVLRPGAVTLEMLAAVIGEVALDPALAGEHDVPRAPGMKYTHYAPKAPMIMVEGAEEKMAAGLNEEIAKAIAAGKKVGVIVSAELAVQLPENVEKAVYGSRTNLDEIAAHLYTALRAFDHSAVDVIFAEGTAKTGLGLAVMNRLQKASGHRIIRLEHV